MGLGIYLAADPATAISEGGAHTNDFLIALDGRIGGTIQKKLYLRNDNSAVYYTNGTLTMGSDELGDTYIDGSIGYSWKLYYGDTQPLDSTWLNIAAGNIMTMSDDLGSVGSPDTTTYLPFWVRVEVPKNVAVRTFTEIQFKLAVDENLV